MKFTENELIAIKVIIEQRIRNIKESEDETGNSYQNLTDQYQKIADKITESEPK